MIKLTIEFKGQKRNITLEEARDLYNELGMLFDKTQIGTPFIPDYKENLYNPLDPPFKVTCSDN